MTPDASRSANRNTNGNVNARYVAEQLRRAFEGGAWHGSALFELLEDVGPALAAWSPGPGRPSLHTLVLHTAAWLEAADRRVHGDSARLRPEEDFPSGGDDPTPAAWWKARSRLSAAFAKLHATAMALRDADLDRTVPGQEYDVRVLLDGVIQHSLWHGGQIALLKKLAPPALA